MVLGTTLFTTGPGDTSHISVKDSSIYELEMSMLHITKVNASSVGLTLIECSTLGVNSFL